MIYKVMAMTTLQQSCTQESQSNRRKFAKTMLKSIDDPATKLNLKQLLNFKKFKISKELGFLCPNAIISATLGHDTLNFVSKCRVMYQLK